ncbi:MAG: 7-carboxy-7-deazaguanine synthase [Planctomycetes bacterium]|nr:7-carboxy-7-deazaguanine synthase [Planctomycetota bacterium]
MSRRYFVKTIYFSLQGEGHQTGRPAVFCRFAGCNLWNGREESRGDAICRFCDTDFVGVDGPGGGEYASPEEVVDQADALWPPDSEDAGAKPFVVCTGGEPLLQLDDRLVAAFHARGWEVAVETNGTRPCPEGVDWVCVSPKAGAPLVIDSGDELKLVYPQEDADPADFASLDFPRFFLQPMDGPDLERNTQAALDYCLAHPQWRLSLQTHKLLGIP